MGAHRQEHYRPSHTKPLETQTDKLNINIYNKHFIHKNNYKILLTLLEGGVSSYILTSGK